MAACPPVPSPTSLRFLGLRSLSGRQGVAGGEGVASRGVREEEVDRRLVAGGSGGVRGWREDMLLALASPY